MQLNTVQGKSLNNSCDAVMLCSLVVKFVEATTSLLAQALVVIQKGDDASRVHAVSEGLDKVLADMQANICTHQVT